MLALVAISGLLLLAFRATAAMGVLLALHFGLVLAFFLLLPFSKMVHAPFRATALLRNAQEARAPSLVMFGEGRASMSSPRPERGGWSASADHDGGDEPPR